VTERVIGSTGKDKLFFPQEPLWKETLAVLSKAKTSDNLAKAKELANLLHFNSEVTRARYGRALATRFARLDEHILSGLCDIAKKDQKLTTVEKIWRILFCMIEPLVGRTYVDLIWPREPGSLIERNDIKSYTETAYSQFGKKLSQRLASCLQFAGYLVPQNKNSYYVSGFGELDNTLIISTHLLFAQSPQTIRLSDLEASHYWKYLGFRKFDFLRVVFRNAESQGLIMRYAVADHLEQITTKFAWKELIEMMEFEK
jgi:hypothetical protein